MDTSTCPLCGEQGKHIGYVGTAKRYACNSVSQQQVHVWLDSTDETAIQALRAEIDAVLSLLKQQQAEIVALKLALSQGGN